MLRSITPLARGRLFRPRLSTVSRFSSTNISSSDGSLHVTSTKFSSLDLSPNTARAIAEVKGFEYLTQVQRDTINVTLSGTDALVRAKTGTGKTVGFLLPVIEAIAKRRTDHLSCLIVAPTRELVQQLHKEATELSKFHNFNILSVFGGVSLKPQQRKVVSRHLDILIATPGRLLDHIDNTPNFANLLKQCDTFVLDEADLLLGMGFRRDLEAIQKALPPPEERQTLLFSATVPDETVDFAKSVMKPVHEYVDTVGQEEENTHAHVPQYVALAPVDDRLVTLDFLLKTHMAKLPNDYKIIVFFSTTAETAYFSQFFSNMGVTNVEMHSRHTQARRTKASDKFRASKSAIMFSSDVSARGVDYPNVTLCVQVGPTSREQYIHRVGRTGRAGKPGVGIMLLSPHERHVLDTLKGLNIQNITDKIPDKESVLMQESVELVDRVLPLLSKSKELKTAAEMAYRAYLGYNRPFYKRKKELLVKHANEFAQGMGLWEPPTIKKKVLHKMGLVGVPGIRVAEDVQLDSQRWKEHKRGVKKQ